MQPHAVSCGSVLFILLVTTGVVRADEVQPVGQGSYLTAIPAGSLGPSDTNGAAVAPRVTTDFTGPPPTNTWWSSLIWERHPGNTYGQPVHAHPLSLQAAPEGLYLGHVTNPNGWDRGYEYSFSGGTAALTLGVEGMTSPDVRVAGAGDWTLEAAWDDGVRSMRAIIGRGLPYVLAESAGGTPIVYASNSSVHSQTDGTLVLQKNGQFWGAFAPDGFTWSQSGDLWRCNGAPAVSVAILPDGNPETIALFEDAALTAVRDTRVSWSWEPESRSVRATYDFTAEPLNGGSGDVLTCLYRHQWLLSEAPLSGHIYPSARGTMKLAKTAGFDVPLPVPGALPQLPQIDSIDLDTAAAFFAESIADTAASFVSDTYWGGKSFGRVAQLAMLADALGETATRDALVTDLKGGLESWFVANGAATFAYDETWGTLIGYPASYGADTELNDHHFHYGYFLWAASVVARFDPEWAATEAWGGMVDMLIRDAANYDRSDDRFCFLRHFEPYASHSYAAGHAGFAAGNNQESSSEAINFATGCLLWGETTGDEQVRDLGLFMLAAESAAVEQYWFDVDEQVFPPVMPRALAGIVWDAGASYSTWWTANAEEIHGINMLPLTGGSLYLGRRSDAVERLWGVFLAENGGEPTVWQDILWSYQALTDATAALESFMTSSFTSEAGDSKARTYWWIAALDGLGRLDPAVGGDAPLSAAFLNGQTRTYAAHNMSSIDTEVTFTDGFTLCVPAQSTATATNDQGSPPCGLVGDIDGNGVIGIDDLLILLSSWGTCPPAGSCDSDLDGNGMTDADDLLLLLEVW